MGTAARAKKVVAKKAAKRKSRASVAKSGAKSGTVPGGFRRGHDPRRGRGPAKGAPNAGRPPNEYVEWCRNILADPDCEETVQAILTDREHPAFSVLYKAISDRGYGKAKQSVEMTGKDGAPLIPLEALREAVADAESISA